MVESLIPIILLSFLIGSIPTGVWVSKIFFGFDIRSKGSGNMGSTNVYRILGVKWGILVQIIDILKGFIPTFFFANFITPDSNQNIIILKLVIGFSAVLGHIFSPFVKFKGGKGINTALGFVLGVSTIDIIISFILFSIVLLTTGFVSLGSIIGGIALPIIIIIRKYLLNQQIEEFQTILIFFLILTFLVVYTHRSNIKRLLNGTENKFKKLQIIKFSRNTK